MIVPGKHFAFVPFGGEQFRVEFSIAHPAPGVIEPSVLTVAGIYRDQTPADDLDDAQREGVAAQLAADLGAVVAGE